jgi:AraC-like DNA-binding protein
MRASSQMSSSVEVSRSGGAPGTPSAWATPQAAPAHRRLRISGGFTVLDRQQRRLHDRAHTLGFTDLDRYLVARCQHDASLAQLAGELGTTIDVIRRLIGEAGIHRTLPKVRSARQRRRATDQRLTERAAQLGFASLHAYLADRVAEQEWKLIQVAAELGVDRETLRDRLDLYGLRRLRQTAR